MADYVVVPYSNYTDAANLYTDGVTVVSTTSYIMRLTQVSTSNEMRFGLFRSQNNLVGILLGIGVPVSTSIRYYFTQKHTGDDTATTIINSAVAMNLEYNGYYYNTMSVPFATNNTTITIFDTSEECLDSLTTAPIINPGVHVQFNPVLLDPNAQAGTSTTGGGEGTFDDTSDPIPIPELPSISAADSGLITLFRPTLSQLQSLGNYLWSNITDFIENINKLLMNPMDYLIALNIFPCIPDVGTTRPIKIGSFSTTIEMPPVVSQWYEFNCGSINVPKYWGSALDYSPNTNMKLFLPFIGSVTLNTDEVMGNVLGVVYRIDLLSGQCVAMVTITGLIDKTASVLYQFTGECGVSVPLTGADWSRVYSAAIGAVGTAITGGIAAGAAGAAAGGATSALASSKAAEAASKAGYAFSRINATSKGVRGVQAMREQMVEAGQMALDAGREAAAAPGRVASGIQSMRIANTVNNTVGAVMSAKMQVSHSGTISGSAGMLGVKTPYLLIEYPNQSLAGNYKHFVGYPSNIYAKLGSLSGYTEVEQVIPEGLGDCTDSEMSELIDALKGGVYL